MGRGVVGRSSPRGICGSSRGAGDTSTTGRAAEARLNAWPQFTTTIDGATVHSAHVRSPEPDATPLVITQGRPGLIAGSTDVVNMTPRAKTNPDTAFTASDPARLALVCSASPRVRYARTPHRF